MSIRQVPSRFDTFDQVVRDICSYLGDDTANELYIKVARFLGRALEQLNLHMIPTIKSTFLTIGDNMSADLPNDILTLSKVGVCDHKNEIRLIGRNDKLCLPEKEPVFNCCDCKEETDSSGKSVKSPGCNSCTFHNVIGSAVQLDGYIFDNVNYLYGRAPVMFKNGTYRYDESNNRLIFGAGCDIEVGAKILVEYNSAMDSREYQLIPRKAYMCLQHRVAFLVQSERNPQKAEFNFRKFRIEWDMLKRTYATYTLEDFLASLRRGYFSAPKR